VYGTAFTAGFPCEGGFCGPAGTTVRSAGAGGGVALHPSPTTWLRSGLIYYGTSVNTGSVRESAGSSPGFEVATGLSLPVAAGLRLVPGASIRSQTGSLRTTLLAADLGLSVSFGGR
jgi:hypothetical protein